MSEPTKGPWTIGTCETRHLDGSPPTHNLTIITEGSEKLITDFGVPQRIGAPLRPEDIANAKFIIKAVNNHLQLSSEKATDTLLAALEDLTIWGEEHLAICKREGSRPLINSLRVKRARAAIAKANGA